MTDQPPKTTRNLHTNAVFELLSDNQMRFVTAMVDNPSFSKKEAAEHIGLNPDTVYRWGSIINDAIEQARVDAHKSALEMQKNALIKAMAVKIALLGSEDESIRSRVATELIEWQLGRATNRTEHTGADGGAMTFNLVFPDDNS